MTTRVFFDGKPVDLPDETAACIVNDTVDGAIGLSPARRPVVMRPLAWLREERWAFVRRDGKWETVRVEGWHEEVQRLRGDLMRAGLRYRAAIGVRGAFYAVADGLHGAVKRAEKWASHGPLPRLRGYGLRFAAKLTPCRCRPGARFFCDRRLPPLPGGHFDRQCDCACHGVE